MRWVVEDVSIFMHPFSRVLGSTGIQTVSMNRSFRSGGKTDGSPNSSSNMYVVAWCQPTGPLPGGLWNSWLRHVSRSGPSSWAQRSTMAGWAISRIMSGISRCRSRCGSPPG